MVHNALVIAFRESSAHHGGDIHRLRQCHHGHRGRRPPDVRHRIKTLLPLGKGYAGEILKSLHIVLIKAKVRKDPEIIEVLIGQVVSAGLPELRPAELQPRIEADT